MYPRTCTEYTGELIQYLGAYAQVQDGTGCVMNYKDECTGPIW
eukprot:SAG11_NODE_664_length_7866_cov_6.323291_5_plen_43_part_00